ncbi:hypothetical protein M0805_008276 [Coniferiporia weirii]|nr:hypothetical protein M0805_008276 [Coniferiporia weirii]
MSIGRPQSFSALVNAPPDRGSFPLDHYGECKDMMKAYLGCLRQNDAVSTPCRIVSKAYLECRMSKDLMGRDEWHNLGLGNIGMNEDSATRLSTSSPHNQDVSSSAAAADTGTK